jgi:hypothetical protein
MKVELIEQYEPFSDEAWYGVKVDGSSVKWTRDKKVANVVYDNIINNIDSTKTREIILKSQEINVSLEETNQ